MSKTLLIYDAKRKPEKLIRAVSRDKTSWGSSKLILIPLNIEDRESFFIQDSEISKVFLDISLNLEIKQLKVGNREKPSSLRLFQLPEDTLPLVPEGIFNSKVKEYKVWRKNMGAATKNLVCSNCKQTIPKFTFRVSLTGSFNRLFGSFVLCTDCNKRSHNGYTRASL